MSIKFLKKKSVTNIDQLNGVLRSMLSWWVDFIAQEGNYKLHTVPRRMEVFKHAIHIHEI